MSETQRPNGEIIQSVFEGRKCPICGGTLDDSLVEMLPGWPPEDKTNVWRGRVACETCHANKKPWYFEWAVLSDEGNARLPDVEIEALCKSRLEKPKVPKGVS